MGFRQGWQAGERQSGEPKGSPLSVCAMFVRFCLRVERPDFEVLVVDGATVDGGFAEEAGTDVDAAAGGVRRERDRGNGKAIDREDAQITDGGDLDQVAAIGNGFDGIDLAGIEHGIRSVHNAPATI